MITHDFERDPYLGASDETRLPLFMKLLKFLDELLILALSAALNETSAFDIVDDEHLKSSIAAVAQLSCIYLFEIKVMKIFIQDSDISPIAKNSITVFTTSD